MTQKEKIICFYLSEYFVVSFLGIIFVHIKRTFKKYPLFYTIIIYTSSFHPFSSCSVHIAVSPRQSPDSTFPFLSSLANSTFALDRMTRDKATRVGRQIHQLIHYQITDCIAFAT